MNRTGEVEVLFWRRIDVPGLERLTLRASGDTITVASTVICLEDGGFQLSHRWRLTSQWRALSLEVEKRGPGRTSRLALARVDQGWTVDNVRRADLDAAEEPDLSVTPFCNSLPIRRLMQEKRHSLTLDTCYVEAGSMTVALSRQRYDRLGSGLLRYIDLGVAAGFEADLQIDRRGLVTHYEGLFARVAAQ